MTLALVVAFLTANILANLVVFWWGPWISPAVAFCLIGLDLSSRDLLHDRWEGLGLPWKMGLLILGGAILSVLLVPGSRSIAMASAVSFVLTGISDAWAYHALRARGRFARMNGSNVVAAFVDSLSFPLIAFGMILPGVSALQFVSKVLGGVLWAWVLVSLRGQRLSPKN